MFSQKNNDLIVCQKSGGENTTPELLLRKALWRKGLRYRLRSSLPGRPDITFPKQKIAIFVDGCFWHKCPKHFKFPKTRTELWINKIEKNIKRDNIVNERLNNIGWTVIRFWEHEVNTNTAACVNAVIHIINLRQHKPCQQNYI